MNFKHELCRAMYFMEHLELVIVCVLLFVLTQFDGW